jgi:hypothetical protein|tara:strand:- start:1846 stop:2172 length:327 start_codon:yes stop_codon:yes gene_type:complete
MSEDNHDLQEDDDDELREIIERALRESVRDKKIFKRKKELAYRLSTIISEYMDSYILLGYDFNGNHLDLKAASTPQKAEALNSFLLKYFASEVHSIKGINPPGPDEIL